jgi:hypothetical protein
LLLLGAAVGLFFISCARTDGPRAIIVTSPPTPVGMAPFTIEFDGSQSTSTNGQIVRYRWEFGDRTEAEGVRVTHTYSKANNYFVSLTVTDEQGETDIARRLITVADAPIQSGLPVDWREYSRKGIANCDGPPHDSKGKRWYEPEYDDSNWNRVAIHDGLSLTGDTAGQDYFYRALVLVSPELLDRGEVTIKIWHNDAFWLWANGMAVPRSEFENPGEASCHEELGRFITTGVLNPYLQPGTNVLALHLTSGDDSAGKPFIQIVLRAFLK